MVDQKEIKKTNPFTIATKSNKIPRNRPTHTDKISVCRKLQDTYERNQRQFKQMERYTLFLYWKNQYCENDYTTQSNLQFHTIPIKLPMAFFKS